MVDGQGRSADELVLAPTNGDDCAEESNCDEGESGKAKPGGMGETAVDAFVTKMLRLLDMERRAEVDEMQALQAQLSPADLQLRGIALLRLKVTESQTGLGGRTIVTLEATTGESLPANQLSPGDIVLLRSARATSPRSSAGQSEDASKVTGVIHRLNDWRVSVSLDDEPPDEALEGAIRLDKLSNDVTYKRQRAALKQLRSCGPDNVAWNLRQVAFGLADSSPSPASIPWTPINSTLDASQRDAVDHALRSAPIALVQGPPGTGKTTTVVEIILQLVNAGHKVLVCAPSNVAVDNLVERLVGGPARIVRVGNPARVLPSVIDHTLDQLVDDMFRGIGLDIRKEMLAVRRQMNGQRNGSRRRELRDQVRALNKELAAHEKQSIRYVLGVSDVVLCTTAGAADSFVRGIEFGAVIIDECAQAMEPSSWIALLRGPRAILVGDDKQLPPTVHSSVAMAQGLGVSLFERLSSMCDESDPRRDWRRLLTVQYRMHQRIMQWSSDEFYGGRLTAAPSVASRTLADIVQGSAEGLAVDAPVIIIDTAGADLQEERGQYDESKRNVGEAGIVQQQVDALIAGGVDPAGVAVISPYLGQVQRLRETLGTRYSALEIGTVDGFQGREKDVVIVSLVRSNDDRQVGFLADSRRINVAITRARRQVVVICDSATVCADPVLERFVQYCTAHALYRSAWEFI